MGIFKMTDFLRRRESGHGILKSQRNNYQTLIVVMVIELDIFVNQNDIWVHPKRIRLFNMIKMYNF